MSKPASSKDVFINSKGEIVGANDPDIAQQIAFKGVVISPKTQARYGLAEDGTSEAPKKKAAKADGEPDAKESKTLTTDSISRESKKSAK